jgi:hypothetical protein
MLEGKSVDTVDTILDEMKLDIKGLMLLNPDDQILSKEISSSLVNSNDPEISRFIKLVQKKDDRATEGGYFLIAVAEIILSSVLFISGLALISPSILGLGSPVQFSQFVTTTAQAIANETRTNPLVPALEFIIALALLLGAFFTLRAASDSLKETGMPRI